MLRPTTIGTIVKRMIERNKETHPTFAVIHSIDLPTVNIRVGSSPTILKNVQVNGDGSNLFVGQRVSTTWEDRPGSVTKVPVVTVGGTGGGSASFASAVADRVTIEVGPSGLQVKKGGIGQQHLNFEAALANHTHPNPLRGEWLAVHG